MLNLDGCHESETDSIAICFMGDTNPDSVFSEICILTYSVAISKYHKISSLHNIS